MSFRKRKRGRVSGTAKDLSQDKRISRIERKLKGVIELKHGINGAVQTLNLNATPVFDDISTEIGTEGRGFKCFIKTLEIRGLVRQNLTSALADDYRFDVVLDRHPEEALPTALQVYGSATPRINALVNWTERKRFKILRSWRGLLEQQNNIGRMFGAVIKVNVMMETDQIDTLGAIASTTKNHFIVFGWTQSTANQPTIVFEHQFVFSDG